MLHGFLGLVRTWEEELHRRQLGLVDEEERQAVLAQTSGLWSDREESGEDYVERLRGGRLAELHEPA